VSVNDHAGHHRCLWGLCHDAIGGAFPLRAFATARREGAFVSPPWSHRGAIASLGMAPHLMIFIFVSLYTIFLVLLGRLFGRFRKRKTLKNVVFPCVSRDILVYFFLAKVVSDISCEAIPHLATKQIPFARILKRTHWRGWHGLKGQWGTTTKNFSDVHEEIMGLFWKRCNFSTNVCEIAIYFKICGYYDEFCLQFHCSFHFF
jgi:hypothetical protein